MHAVSAITILRFLLSPEDSSAPAPDPNFTDVSVFVKIMKPGVWIAVSVVAAILLGNLQAPATSFPDALRKTQLEEIEKMIEEIRRGASANLPVGASVAAYGSVLGMLAAQKGITWLQLLIMNLSVFAGSAQFVMVEMWVPPLPIVEMTLAVMVINMRYLLIGASLEPLFNGQSLLHKMGVIHLVADENWAVTMAAYRRNGATTGFLLGGGMCLCAIWSMGTLLGHRLGALVTHPERFALDFAFVAVFTALTVSLWRGSRDLAPWVAAAILAVAAEQWLPGKWYIVIGGIGGALVPVLQAYLHNRERPASASDSSTTEPFLKEGP